VTWQSPAREANAAEVYWQPLSELSRIRLNTDHGSNYTSRDYAELLDELGLSQSLGRTSICYDNAAAESFFATLKKELLYRAVYPTREKAMRDIARCMRKGRTTKERNR
jgi:putative transposase